MLTPQANAANPSSFQISPFFLDWLDPASGYGWSRTASGISSATSSEACGGFLDRLALSKPAPLLHFNKAQRYKLQTDTGDRTATIAAEYISSLPDFAISPPPTLKSVLVGLRCRRFWSNWLVLVYFKCHLLLLGKISQLCDRHIKRPRQFQQSTNLSAIALAGDRA